MNEVKKTVFRLKEVARYLCVSEWMVRDLVRKKDIPYYRIGRLYMFDKEIIDKWRNSRIIGSEF